MCHCLAKKNPGRLPRGDGILSSWQRKGTWDWRTDKLEPCPLSLAPADGASGFPSLHCLVRSLSLECGMGLCHPTTGKWKRPWEAARACDFVLSFRGGVLHSEDTPPSQNFAHCLPLTRDVLGKSKTKWPEYHHHSKTDNLTVKPRKERPFCCSPQLVWCLMTVLVCWGCPNEVRQTRWLKGRTLFSHSRGG